MTDPAARPRLETLALHAGFRADPVTGSVVPPIHQTTSYQFRDTEHARRLFGLEEVGYTYTRTVNPSREVLEKRVAALEGGVSALALASGAAATLCSLLALAGAGDNVVLAASVADGRQAGLLATLPRCGIEARLADPADPAAFARRSDDRTRAWFGESLSLPDLAPLPVAALAAAAARAGVPLLIDNSATPLSLRPAEQGAAVVLYAAGGYLGGHGAATGGLAIDTGRFDWEAAGPRQPRLNGPDPSYHGRVWSEVVKQWRASPFIARLRGGLLRDFGPAISPLTVFQVLQGIETLPLRLRHHHANAREIAARFANHPALAGLIPSPSGLIALDLGDAARAARLIDRLALIRRAGEYGSGQSVVLPLPRAPGRLLLSVGLEHPDDIARDLESALGGA